MRSQETYQWNTGISGDKITVLLASYQGASYLSEQLDSILNQTIPVSRVIVSDDGSTDGTRQILEDYCRRYPGRILLNHHVKEGQFAPRPQFVPPAAMNFFWLLSGEAASDCSLKADYVMLSDQDDVWKPEKTEVLLKRMKELEASLGKNHPILVHSDMEVVDRQLKQISPSLSAYQHGDLERKSFSQILVENPVTGGAVMMNRALAELVSQVPDCCLMHDWWIALAASCFGTISFVPEALYLYRQHGDNALGAREIGSAGELKERMGRQQQVEETYRKMFAQAKAFGKRYKESMTPETKRVLQAYLALPLQTPVGRFRNIGRNHFYKSSKLQTLAQCVTIPRHV